MNEAEAIVCDVRATMKYVVRGEKATFHAGDRARSYWPVDEHEVTIHDVRPIRESLAFDRNGFVLVEESTDVTEFTDKDELARYCRQTEALVRQWAAETSSREQADRPARDPDEIRIEDKLRSALGTRVALRKGAKGAGGSLTIQFFSDEQLQGIYDRLVGEDLW